MVIVSFLQNWQACEQITNKDLYFILLAVAINPMIQPQNIVLFCEMLKIRTEKAVGHLCLSLCS